MKNIRNFILHNAEWIEGQLDIQPLIGSLSDTTEQPEAKFVINIDAVPKSSFNPLQLYNTVGDCQLDHVSSPIVSLFFLLRRVEEEGVYSNQWDLIGIVCK